MAASLTPWRSCTVSIYRYRQIGIQWIGRTASERCFTDTMDFVRRCGTTDDADGWRHVYAPAADGHLRLIDLSDVDWSGLDEALAAVRAKRAA